MNLIQRYLDELSVVSLDHKKTEFNRTEFFDIIYGQESDITYITFENQLYGVISAGDIKRCENGIIKINQRFTYLLNWDYRKAKKIFSEKRNINKVPVVDETGCLLGDYSRWDDKRWYRRSKEVCLHGLFNSFINKEMILVNPGKEKQWMFEFVRDCFAREKVKYKVCCMKDFPLFLTKEEAYWIFVDEEDLYCVKGIYRELIKYPQSFFTFKDLIESVTVSGEEKGILNQLMERGVQCITVSDRPCDGPRFRGALKKRFKNVNENFFPKEFAEGFFEELYSEEYYESIVNIPLEMYCENGVNKIKDVRSKFFNVSDGQRATLGQPLEYENKIYFFGPCIMIGRYVEDKHTVESFLQNRLNDIGLRYKVVNCGAYNGKKLDINRILETDFNCGDIAVIWSYDRNYLGIPDISLPKVAEKYRIPIQWTLNTLPHCNHKVNKILADEIFLRLQVMLEEKVLKCEDSFDGIRREYISRNYIKRYFLGFDYTKYKKIGSIVMNCNPFTNGHRYLIESACQMVDFLVIFVVEEDKSFFSFEERFEMVREGVRDLNHVMVVPSGQFIFSETTFPEYFLKIQDEDIYRNVDYDITLFADYIASELHITHRFVGEEPYDNVTNEYNNAMKRILPEKGICLVEIPRKKDDGIYISASEVRKSMGDKKRAYKLVPDTTRKVLGWN